LRKYFTIDNKLYLIVCSVGCSFLLETRATIISNEHPLLLVCWLIVCTLLILESNIDNNKKRIQYTILLVLLLVYSLTLHTRAITLWLALGLCVIFYFWVYRKWIVSLPVFAILGAGGVIAGGIAIAYLQQTLWSQNGGTALENSHFNIDLTNFLLLSKVTSWQAWVNIILGQLNNVGLVTCGMATIGIVILCSLFWKGILRQPTFIQESKANHLSKFILIGSFFGSAVIITIGGQSISWLPAASEGIIAGFGSKYYGYKAFIYFRYFGLYTGPLLMLVFAYAYLFKDKLMTYCKSSTLVFLLLQAYFMVCIVPYIYNFQEYTTTQFRPFVFFQIGRKTNVYTFLGTAFVLFVIWIIIWFSYYKKNIVIPALLVTLMLMYQYVSLTKHYDIHYENKRYQMVNSSYELMTELQTNTDIPKDIYVVAPPDSTSTVPYFIFQFYLNHYHVIPGLPTDTGEESIAFYEDADYDALLNLGYTCIQLDKNESIYIKGEHLLSVIQEQLAKNSSN
jgi:hypothetical protein